MADAIWVMRYSTYEDDELKAIIRRSVPGSECEATLAAIEVLAGRVVARDALKSGESVAG